MPYPEFMVTPMRKDLTEVGFHELRTPEEVETAFNDAHDTLLLVVNSVCGCAAANARPAVKRPSKTKSALHGSRQFLQAWNSMR